MTGKAEKRPTRQPGHNWGTPIIVVQDMNKAIKTYTEVFGFTVDRKMDDKAGNPVFAKLRYQDFDIMVDLEIEDPAAMGFDTSRVLKAPKKSGINCPIVFYIYHDDIESILKKAKQKGLTIVQEPEVMFWGDKTTIIKDEDGYEWEFATNVADFDPSKLPPSWK